MTTEQIESMIFCQLISDLVEAGFSVSGRGNDDWADDIKPLTYTEFAKYGSGFIRATREEFKGWVLLICGNGPDFISDFSSNMEEFIANALDHSDFLAGQWVC